MILAGRRVCREVPLEQGHGANEGCYLYGHVSRGRGRQAYFPAPAAGDLRCFSSCPESCPWQKGFRRICPLVEPGEEKAYEKNLAIVVAAVALSGCATFGQLEDGLNALVGRHEKEAFSALGYPNSKQEFSGDTVYYWGESRNSAVFMPQTATTTGYVGRTPVFGTTTSSQLVPVSYNCTIKLVVGEGKVIKDWEFSGNLAGCEPYIKRVKSYTKGGPS